MPISSLTSQMYIPLFRTERRELEHSAHYLHTLRVDKLLNKRVAHYKLRCNLNQHNINRNHQKITEEIFMLGISVKVAEHIEIHAVGTVECAVIILHLRIPGRYK